MKISFDQHATKDWLVRALDPISDAEPALLADFIIALLANDVPGRRELRANCIEQLVDFLEDNTTSFVDALMQYLEAPHDTSIPLPYGNGKQDVAAAAAAAATPMHTHADQPSPRDRKRPRTPPQSYPPGMPFKQPRITPNPFLYPAAAGQSMMPGFNGMHMPQQQQQQPLRGYCPRGAACPFQHDVMLTPGLPVPAPMAAAAGMPPRPAQRRQQPADRGLPSARSRPARGETRCVRVEHIPPHCASDAAVRQFFNPFGKIAGVSVDKNACTAMVAFSDPAEAERALASPQPIFGNRFVRTYRAQEDPALFVVTAPTDVPTEDVNMDGGDSAKGEEGEVTNSATALPTATSQAVIAAANEAKAKTAAERAQQLEANSARQKEVLGQLEGADKEQKRALLQEMRSLTEVAERLLREAKEAAAAAPAGPEDARARLERLRRETFPASQVLEV
ncbi:hypothetical protein RHOSPDRAFT_27871 [Rhodotorula sp. JG-1b]|nr:hypothetical protein RHOSPDRAFT_27871 [Rhodotorula sp. JG-1b]